MVACQCLGPSETGKTTVLKQLKLMYSTKGLETERQTYRRVVHLNVMRAIQALMEGLQDANIPLEKEENVQNLEILLDSLEVLIERYLDSANNHANPAIPRKITDAKAESDMFTDVVPVIKALWADAGIQTTFQTITQLHIQDSAK